MLEAKNVDAYIARAPKEMRGKLRELRTLIRNTASKAEERISYGMPYYAYKGPLAYFAAFKKHISLFLPPPIVEEHKRELKGYVTTKAAVHLSPHKRLPGALVKKLIRARMKRNEAGNKK
ncbi:MAG TPA: DUF1801 domain-containing protein [Candidatus Xenobia bacterium]|nr:DUF1801 domain-containing protein [Candidatus Xenobia bacterium]